MHYDKAKHLVELDEKIFLYSL